MDSPIKKIFVGSPSDTAHERKIVDNVVQEFNHSLGDILKMKFETVKWETHSTPSMGRPQGVINTQLKIKQCDLFLGIIWSRFGSPSGGLSADAVPYESGTEEEFDIAYQSWKTTGTPTLMIFRSVKKFSAKSVDVEQLSKVQHFLEEFSYDKSHPGLYKEYSSQQNFEKELRMSLIQYAISQNARSEQKESLHYSITGTLGKYGITDVFVPELNAQRNIAKKESLENSKNIYLIAHSCYSFIAQFGHRFRDIIEQKLQEGYSFMAVASNPWSESSFFAALGEAYEHLSDYEYCNADGNKYLDCIKIIEQAQCYRVKYKDSINGYLMLKKKYGDRIKLRFTQYEMMSSILLTDNDCYIEPYLPVNLEERYEKGMLTFELKVSKDSYLYRHNKKYFDFLWELSEEYESYISHIEEYKARLKNKSKMGVK